MKKLLFLLLLNNFCWAISGPIYKHENEVEQKEWEHLYESINNPSIHTVDITTATISSSTITNLNVSTINGTSFYNFQASTQCFYATTFTTNSSVFTATGLSCSITPSAATSRVKVTVSGTMDSLSNATQASLAVFAGTRIIGQNAGGIAGCSSSGATTVCPVSFSVIDAPLIASATTYTVKLLSTNGASSVQFVGGMDQILILEEVK